MSPVEASRTQPSPLSCVQAELGPIGECLAGALGITEVLECHRGQLVLEEGQRPRDLYYVADGLLTAVKQDPDGREAVLHVAEPGDLVGLELLSDLSLSASWQAVLPSQLTPLPVKDVRAAAADDPQLAAELASLQNQRLARLEQRVCDVSLKDSRHRVCRVLLDRAKCPSTRLDRHTVSNLTRQDLAAMAAMTPETFIRNLTLLRDRGIVKTLGQDIIILASDTLAEIASSSNGAH